MAIPSSGAISMTTIQTEFGGSNPIGLNEYYAGGTYVPAGTSGTYGTVPSSGALSVRNFYGTSSFIPTYIEEVFSPYIYTGNGSAQAITTGINISGSGGLVWTKSRATSISHSFFDTNRGAGKYIVSSTSAAEVTDNATLTSFSTTGFNIGSSFLVNQNDESFTSWTFRKQAKFFDVVTYTGNSTNGRAIAHNLGSVPGMVIIKRTNTTSTWRVQHRSINVSTVGDLRLDSTEAAGNPGLFFTAQANASSVFVSSNSEVNAPGNTYVMYVFAHDAGGFGLNNTDNVISCGAFTVDGVGRATVNLGYEPQFIIMKPYDQTGNWLMLDTRRGWNTGTEDTQQFDNMLFPNLANSENTLSNYGSTTSSGFDFRNPSYGSYNMIYMAIRKGPMKIPTVATTVFAPTAYAGNGSLRTIAPSFVPDTVITKLRNTTYISGNSIFTRLTALNYLRPPLVNAQVTSGQLYFNNVNNGYQAAGEVVLNDPSYNYVSYSMVRAPKVHDVVCWVGNNSARTIAHNLTIAPELMIVKMRDGTTEWSVYSATQGASKTASLNTGAAFYTDTTIWNNTTPTSSVFSVGNNSSVNNNGNSYIAYLFGTCPGVSKVGSYTGSGALRTIDCGFTGGARFVMIKRTDNTSFWFIWDTSRGMVTGTDPSFGWNSNNAEVNANSVNTIATGFQLLASPADAVNTAGAPYIFLAIA